MTFESMLQAFVLLALVFAPLERVLPNRRDQRVFRRGFWNDLCYVAANGVLVRLALTTILLAQLAAADALLSAEWRSTVAGLPLWLQVAGALVVGDLGFYAAHRLFHRVPLLWRFHSIHHSIEELDWLAGHRVHAVDQIATKSISFLPVIFLGFSPAAVAIWAATYAWHSVLLHSNVRIPFGPFGVVFASPRFHRWHHSSSPEARDRNFAGQLSLLDRLLGTAYDPAGQEPSRFGIDERVPSNWFTQFLYPVLPDKPPRPGA